MLKTLFFLWALHICKKLICIIPLHFSVYAYNANVHLSIAHSINVWQVF